MRTALAAFTLVAIALGGCGQSGEQPAAERPSSTGTVGIAGECAVVMLISTSEKKVRDAVEQIH